MLDRNSALIKFFECKLATRLGMAFCLLCLAGCGQGEPFQPMSGAVTLDGAPLKKGVITFFPIGPGTTVGGEVIEGQFALAKESGATPGKYRVEIVAFRPSGKSELDIDTNSQVDIEVQILPPRYNTKSELTCDVVESGKNEYSFDLKLK